MMALIVILIVVVIIAVKRTAHFLVSQLGNTPTSKTLNIDITRRFLKFLCLTALVILVWSIFRLAVSSSWLPFQQFCSIHCLSPVGVYALYLSAAIGSFEVLLIAMPYARQNPKTK